MTYLIRSLPLVHSIYFILIKFIYLQLDEIKKINWAIIRNDSNASNTFLVEIISFYLFIRHHHNWSVEYLLKCISDINLAGRFAQEDNVYIRKKTAFVRSPTRPSFIRRRREEKEKGSIARELRFLHSGISLISR